MHEIAPAQIQTILPSQQEPVVRSQQAAGVDVIIANHVCKEVVTLGRVIPNNIGRLEWKVSNVECGKDANYVEGGLLNRCILHGGIPASNRRYKRKACQ